MVPAVIDSPLIHQAHQHVLSSFAEEEEGLKRNTDCVYFLASPLTCKKDSECEYRHSEMARLNPRDCWYWINANCLNAKCAFRHPPVDGLLGTQAATSSAPMVSTSQTFTKLAMYNPGLGHQIVPANATYNQGRQTVPCVFFQQGFCGKGSRCTFPHGMSPISDPINVKKASSVPQKCSHPQANVPKLSKVPSTANPDTKSKSHVSKDRLATEKSYFQSTQLSEEGSRNMEAIVTPVMNGSAMNWSNTVAQNEVSDDSQDGDEFYRESSPGFDVLVDDELRDADYFRDDGHFGRRNLNEIYVDGSSDYNQAADVCCEKFHDHPNGYGSYNHPHGYDSYDPRMQVKSDLMPHHRDSPQRNSVRSDSLERRGYDYCRAENTNSDLRRQVNQERVYGFRSDITHEYLPERSLSSRLEGRINIPERSSNIYRSNRDFKRGTNSRNARVPEDFNNNKRNFRGPHTRRDNIMSNTRTDFTGPKSLAELKASKTGGGDRNELQMEGQDSFSVRKQGNQLVNGDVSFEGPKPLSEILKRKREVESLNEGNNHLLNVQENSSKYAKVEPVARIDGLQSSLKEPYVTEVEAENETAEDFDYEQPIDGAEYNLDHEGEEEEYIDEYIDDDEAEDSLTR